MGGFLWRLWGWLWGGSLGRGDGSEDGVEFGLGGEVGGVVEVDGWGLRGSALDFGAGWGVEVDGFTAGEDGLESVLGDVGFGWARGLGFSSKRSSPLEGVGGVCIRLGTALA